MITKCKQSTKFPIWAWSDQEVQFNSWKNAMLHQDNMYKFLKLEIVTKGISVLKHGITKSITINISVVKDT